MDWTMKELYKVIWLLINPNISAILIPISTCLSMFKFLAVFMEVLVKVCMLPFLCVYNAMYLDCLFFGLCGKLCILPQGYVVCPSEKRFLLLFTFLKKNRKKKLMVFFSSCMSVKYHYELLNYIDLPVMAIHVSCFADHIHLKAAHKALLYAFIKSHGIQP